MKRPGEQIAAMPFQWDESGKLRILMITSRETGRWVIPKGWRIDGLKAWQAAKVEALEEAGADGHVSSRTIGRYHYEKVLDDGSRLVCTVQIFPMLVKKLKRTWKERRERERKWFASKAASRRVDEAELAELLRDLEKKPELKSLSEEFRGAP